jgi:hypothetical protein
MATAALKIERFGDTGLAAENVTARLTWLREVVGPRLERFMGYYRNPTGELEGSLPCAAGTRFSVRPFRQYQELGLPARVTGFRRGSAGGASAVGAMDVHRREVVIENDIAWRVNTLVDFAAGRMPAVVSAARDVETRARLTAVIGAVLEAAGGVGLLQELVLQGAVYGSAWVHVRPTEELLGRLGEQRGEGREGGGRADAEGGQTAEVVCAATGQGGPVEIARWLSLEIVEAFRLCPLPRAGEGCGIGYAAVLMNGGEPAEAAREEAGAGIFARVRKWLGKPAGGEGSAGLSFDLFGPRYWQRYVKGELAGEGANALGFVPFVRYENGRDPAAGTRVGAPGSGVVDTGAGEVEPLIGLQDELNTRLSDRAYRVTMTAFRMFLGKGIEAFVERPVGPGQMWQTENTAASVEMFGGDAGSPSEESHINEVREALDKISGVSPVAAGLLRGKLGNLTSAVALRLTLIALLARTDRRRAALARVLSEVVRMVLTLLDRAGVVESAAEDRGIVVSWPTAIPESDMDKFQEAQAKVALGVPREVVLGELGYSEAVTGQRT